ncbi:hypothetical protein CHX27_08230 [Flavobacterium aurantiibacter]|uniref:Glycosyltransferase family 1 protein n=2 Tax=Flavobacterium aurantiibacter TaxID=2023067 RepID=A0A255ZQW7_9FLAO|nr:hypothetical protein CHX27_08230 [Flavobacterium aurantiibacter]
MFKDAGFEVHVACNDNDEIPGIDKNWLVPFVRSPFSKGHYKAFTVLKEIIDNENFTIIHCHTPMASLLTRFAAKNARNNGTKVIYTAHGFHFFTGAPIINWLTYYPIELYASRFADGIITINREDFVRIKKFGNQKTKYFATPGVGVDSSKFFPVSESEKATLRAKLGFAPDDFLITYAAEFIDRKNHKFLVNFVKKYGSLYPNLKFLFCGRGVLLDAIKAEVEHLNLQKQIVFLGFRNDIDAIFKMSDLGISSSKQEGLGLNLVEEQMCGLPILATVDRGHKEIVIQGENGFLYKQGDLDDLNVHLNKLYNDKALRERMGAQAIKTAANFELSNCLRETKIIYNQFLNNVL